MVFLAQHVQEFAGEIYIYLFSLTKAIGNFVQALFHVSLYILYAYALVLIIGTYVIIALLIGYSALMKYVSN